jgi:hypothetical protein
MVDTTFMPTVPPDPPEASGPIDGSLDWTAVEETKKKRREFGAGIAFPTGDKIWHFVLEIRFKQKLDDTDADGSTLNLHGINREFVAKLMASTEGDAHLMPPAKEKNRLQRLHAPSSMSTRFRPRTAIIVNSFIKRSITASGTKGQFSKFSILFS